MNTGPIGAIDQSRIAAAVSPRMSEEAVDEDPLLLAFLERGSSRLLRELVRWSLLAIAAIAGGLAAWQSKAIISVISAYILALRTLLPKSMLWTQFNLTAASASIVTAFALVAATHRGGGLGCSGL